jgi:hypothetical protein
MSPHEISVAVEPSESQSTSPSAIGQSTIDEKLFPLVSLGTSPADVQSTEAVKAAGDPPQYRLYRQRWAGLASLVVLNILSAMYTSSISLMLVCCCLTSFATGSG